MEPKTTKLRLQQPNLTLSNAHLNSYKFQSSKAPYFSNNFFFSLSFVNFECGKHFKYNIVPS